MSVQPPPQGNWQGQPYTGGGAPLPPRQAYPGPQSPQPAGAGYGGVPPWQTVRNTPLLGLAIASMAAGLLGVIGSLGPWASAKLFGNELVTTGFDGDGVVTMILSMVIIGLAAAAAFVPAAQRLFWIMIPAGALALISVIIAIIDMSRLSGLGKTGITGNLVQIGWGLYFVLIASLVVLGASVAHVVLARKQLDLASTYAVQPPHTGAPQQGGQPWSQQPGANP